MITLAIAELLHALAPQLKGWFGGESGVSTMRMPAWGFDFGSTTQVYYLTLAWVLVSLARCTSTRRTPLGRLTLALRENAHRLRFLGYDVHGLGVSAFAHLGHVLGHRGRPAGHQQRVGQLRRCSMRACRPAVVLNCYIGGVGSFLGPALGAALMTFFGYAVSDLTQVLAALPGHAVRAGDDVHARRASPGWSGARRRWCGAMASRGCCRCCLLWVVAARAAGRRRGRSSSRCCSACSRRTTARWRA